jgi:hypothetical protein
MTIEVILINETQKAWVENENATSQYTAIICNHGQGLDIDAVVLTATGYEAWATYFSGATVTEIEIDSPF